MIVLPFLIIVSALALRSAAVGAPGGRVSLATETHGPVPPPPRSQVDAGDPEAPGAPRPAARPWTSHPISWFECIHTGSALPFLPSPSWLIRFPESGFGSDFIGGKSFKKTFGCLRNAGNIDFFPRQWILLLPRVHGLFHSGIKVTLCETQGLKKHVDCLL